MSLLTIVQAVCKRVGVSSPVNAYSSTDDNIVRIIALANEEGEELANEYAWQALTHEATHTTVAAESQGSILTIAGSDFGWIKNDTLFDRTANRPVIPVDDVQWQQMKASGITGPYSNVRIRGNTLLASPTPTAGHTWAFEWVSKDWCEDSAGTGQDAWGADSDVARLDEKLITMGVIWRFKQSQGFEYGEDFNKYQRRLQNALARDGAKPRIHMGKGGGRFISNKNVEEGSWTL